MFKTDGHVTERYKIVDLCVCALKAAQEPRVEPAALICFAELRATCVFDGFRVCLDGWRGRGAHEVLWTFLVEFPSLPSFFMYPPSLEIGLAAAVWTVIINGMCAGDMRHNIECTLLACCTIRKRSSFESIYLKHCFTAIQ